MNKPTPKPLTNKQPNKKPASVDAVIDQKIDAAKLGDSQDEGDFGPIHDKKDQPLTQAEEKAEAKDAEHLNPAPEAPANPAIPVTAEQAYKDMLGGPLPSAPHKATPEPIREITQDIEDEQNGEVTYVATLEQAQALPEADEDLKGKPAGKNAAFEFFKSHDGRTMRLIEVAGRHLAAQEVKAK